VRLLTNHTVRFGEARDSFLGLDGRPFDEQLDGEPMWHHAGAVYAITIINRGN
jgi:hypothetical protein